MSELDQRPRAIQDLPRAKRERNWKTRLFWLIPVGAAALAAYFVYSNLIGAGPTLHIFFQDAAGLEPGKSQVKYRGARIGTLKEMKLTPDHQQVEVTVALDRSADSIAREGSRFWIVKPEVGAAQITGLRTIVSGDYITVEPGNGKPQTRFIGLSQAPIPEPKNVLSIVLLSEKADSLKERSPVFYRGIQVGQVIDFQLSPGSQTVQATVDIEPEFAPLVRMNSRFWNAGGINISLGLSGADISAKSAQALLSGGVAFATPDQPDKQASPGTSFRLYDKPEDAWLAWAPSISLKTTNSKSQFANQKIQ